MSALRNVLVDGDDPLIARSFDRVLSGKGYAELHTAKPDAWV